MAAPHTIAVVLAAGGGSRFAGPQHKLLAELDGRSIAHHAIDAARRARIGPIVVVTGAVDPFVVADATGTDPADANLAAADNEIVTVVHNPEWAAGQATSLQVGLRAAEQLGATAVVVGLADQPAVAPEAWRRVAASDSPIAIATYDGARRNPVRLDASVWPLLPTSGDAGARSLARMRPDLVEEVPCPGSAADIDTLEDLESWQNKSSTNSR